MARSEGRQPLFFSLMSYTAAALAWADEVGMALFRFDHAGAGRSRQRPRRGAAGGRRRARCPAAAGLAGPAVGPGRAGGRSPGSGGGSCFAERVACVGLGWIWVQLVRLDYTVPTRRAVAHRATTLAFDLVSGAPFPWPGVEPDGRRRDNGGSETVGEKGPLPATMETTAVLRQITDTWEKLEAVTRPAVVERHRAALVHLGVPPEALTVSPSAGERVLAPVFVGLLEHRRDSAGSWCAVGSPVRRLSDLASHLTSRLPGALEEIVGRVRRL